MINTIHCQIYSISHYCYFRVVHTWSDKPSLFCWCVMLDICDYVYVFVTIVNISQKPLELGFQMLLHCLHDRNPMWVKDRADITVCAPVLKPTAASCRDKVLEGVRLFHVDMLTAIWTGCRLLLGESSRIEQITSSPISTHYNHWLWANCVVNDTADQLFTRQKPPLTSCYNCNM